jgi:hydroxyethylthiazole kinase
MFQTIRKVHARLKQEKPLILNITNYVTMDFIANGLLSLGASPVMTTEPREVEDLTKLSRAVVINLGTLNEEFIALCEQVCCIANQLKKPIILDPVGAGASKYRTKTCLALINKYNVAIIRGNGSEIMALAGSDIVTKGVESSVNSNTAIEMAKKLSRQSNGTIVLTGETDFIVDHDMIYQSKRGSPVLPMVTGSGCLLSAVIGAFHAVEKNRFDAACAATVFYSVCGEKAADKSQSPGTFKSHFLDALYEAK